MYFNFFVYLYYFEKISSCTFTEVAYVFHKYRSSLHLKVYWVQTVKLWGKETACTYNTDLMHLPVSTVTHIKHTPVSCLAKC